jgi:hypothetical protein
VAPPIFFTFITRQNTARVAICSLGYYISLITSKANQARHVRLDPARAMDDLITTQSYAMSCCPSASFTGMFVRKSAAIDNSAVSNALSGAGKRLTYATKIGRSRFRPLGGFTGTPHRRTANHSPRMGGTSSRRLHAGPPTRIASASMYVAFTDFLSISGHHRRRPD